MTKGDCEKLWDQLPGGKMPFDWEAFAHKHRILYRDHGGLKAVAGPMAFRLFLYGLGQKTWFLDELLYPNWRQAKLSGPIFILGHQRSGTTFLHRLLADDKTHGRSLLFHEMLLPANSFQNALARIGKFDSTHSGRLGKWFKKKQDALFGPMDDIHRIRFDEVEEDEFVLWAIYASAMCVNDSPISTADEKLEDIRHFNLWPVRRQAAALTWYRACLLKKAYREPSPDDHPVWGISKNPAFGQKIPALLKVFPNAKFINLVRNPMQTIPSRLSLIRAIWRQRFPGFDQMTKEQVKTIFEDSLRIYLYAERDLANVPEPNKLTIRYEDLSANPTAVIDKIYEHFELPGPDANLQNRLQSLASRQKSYKSKHVYDLSEFHLTQDDILIQLKQVFENYYFPR